MWARSGTGEKLVKWPNDEIVETIIVGLEDKHVHT